MLWNIILNYFMEQVPIHEIESLWSAEELCAMILIPYESIFLIYFCAQTNFALVRIHQVRIWEEFFVYIMYKFGANGGWRKTYLPAFRPFGHSCKGFGFYQWLTGSNQFLSVTQNTFSFAIYQPNFSPNGFSGSLVPSKNWLNFTMRNFRQVLEFVLWRRLIQHC